MAMKRLQRQPSLFDSDDDGLLHQRPAVLTPIDWPDLPTFVRWDKDDGLKVYFGESPKEGKKWMVRGDVLAGTIADCYQRSLGAKTPPCLCKKCPNCEHAPKCRNHRKRCPDHDGRRISIPEIIVETEWGGVSVMLGQAALEPLSRFVGSWLHLEHRGWKSFVPPGETREVWFIVWRGTVDDHPIAKLR